MFRLASGVLSAYMVGTPGLPGVTGSSSGGSGSPSASVHSCSAPNCFGGREWRWGTLQGTGVELHSSPRTRTWCLAPPRDDSTRLPQGTVGTPGPRSVLHTARRASPQGPSKTSSRHGWTGKAPIHHMAGRDLSTLPSRIFGWCAGSVDEGRARTSAAHIAPEALRRRRRSKAHPSAHV